MLAARQAGRHGRRQPTAAHSDWLSSAPHPADRRPPAARNGGGRGAWGRAACASQPPPHPAPPCSQLLGKGGWGDREQGRQGVRLEQKGKRSHGGRRRRQVPSLPRRPTQQRPAPVTARPMSEGVWVRLKRRGWPEWLVAARGHARCGLPCRLRSNCRLRGGGGGEAPPRYPDSTRLQRGGLKVE